MRVEVSDLMIDQIKEKSFQGWSPGALSDFFGLPVKKIYQILKVSKTKAEGKQNGTKG